MYKKSILTLTALALAAQSFALSLPKGTYEMDTAHSKIGFEVTHLVVATVDGRFKKAEATLTLDPITNKSKVTATIYIASVDTGNEKRDTHLRSGDFFAADKYPKMTFTSRSFKLKGNKLTVDGDLTLRGVTKAVTLKGRFRGVAKDGYGNEKVGASLRGTINRKDFGVAWNALVEAGPVVSDEVDLILNIEAGRPLDKENK
jgi:polyisoprenoid-binding protein YceI